MRVWRFRIGTRYFEVQILVFDDEGIAEAVYSIALEKSTSWDS